MHIFKALLLIFGLFVLFVVTTVGVFVFTFDANEYKQDLSGLVKSKTGRDLVFSGDIGLTFYPSLGMSLGSMTFSNPPGFGEQPMLSVTEASVSVDLFSLLRFEPEIAQLVLDGLQLQLQKNAEGKTNWDDLAKVSTEETPKEAPKESPTAPTVTAEVPLALTFGGLNITRANLTWQDDQAGQVYQLKNLSLQTSRIQPNEPFNLQLSTRIQSTDQLDADVTFNTQVFFKEKLLRLSGMKLQTSAKGSLLPFNLVNLSSSGDVEFSSKTSQLAVRGFDARISTAGGALQQASVALTGEIGFDLDQQHLTVGALDVRADIVDASVPNGKISSGVSASKLDLKLNQRSVSLEELNLALNENRFQGFVKVRDYARPAVAFELSTERFDVDKLMGTPAVTPEQPAEQAPEDVQISLPMQLLRDLQLDGQLKAGTLIAQGLTVNDVLIKLHADQGVIDIKPLQLNLYDGSLAGQLKLDARGEKPVYSVSQKLSGFQIGRFLTDFMGDDKVSGEANLDIQLQTRGEWLSELKGGLDGTMAVSMKDGALKGFNLREEIDRARAKLKGEKVAERAVQKTDFSALSLSAVVRQGVVSTDDLNLQAPLLRVGGKGSANLVEETVNYQVNAKLVGTTKGQQGGEADELSGLMIPVAITGPWLSPDINVLLDDMLKAKLNAEKAQIREQIEKEKAAVQQKLAEEKARLKAAQEKEAAAKKAQLEQQRKLAEAEQKAKLEAEKQRQQAELDAKKKAEEEKARQKLEDKLKKLF